MPVERFGWLDTERATLNATEEMEEAKEIPTDNNQSGDRPERGKPNVICSQS